MMLRTLIITATLCLLPITIPIELSTKRLPTKEQIIQETYKYKNQKLLVAIIEVESNFNTLAKSNKNAIGLTQIRPAIWREQLIENNIIRNDFCLYNHKKNIKSSVHILSKLEKRYNGNLEKMMNHYSGDRTGRYYKKVINKMKKS